MEDRLLDEVQRPAALGSSAFRCNLDHNIKKQRNSCESRPAFHRICGCLGLRHHPAQLLSWRTPPPFAGTPPRKVFFSIFGNTTQKIVAKHQKIVQFGLRLALRHQFGTATCLCCIETKGKIASNQFFVLFSHHGASFAVDVAWFPVRRVQLLKTNKFLNPPPPLPT